MPNFFVTSGAFLAAFIGATLSVHAASLNFSVFDAPGAVATYANGINNSGEVVGSTINSAGLQQGFIDNDGTFTYINVFGAVSTSAQAVNNAGQIVGSYMDMNGVTHGFVDSAGTIFTFDAPISGATGTSLMGINAAGELVGFYGDSSYVQHGFSIASSVLSTIAPSGASSSSASAINASGQITGYTTTGFVDNNGTYTTVSAGTRTEPNGINAAGQIVGNFTNTTGEHGFLDVNGVYTTIDAPGGFGFTDVTGINDSGVMVGYFEDAGGITDSFITVQTPEPTSFLLLGAGLLAVGVFRRRSA